MVQTLYYNLYHRARTQHNGTQIMALNISGVRLEGGIQIASPPVPVAVANVITQTINQNASMTPYTPLTATGGTLPYNYFVKSGTLPTGVTLNSSTGQITGTPSATYGPNNITFGVEDANQQRADVTATVTFTVQSVPYGVSYLIVAGGGGSGGGKGTPASSTTVNGRGGGGAGGLKTGSLTLTPTFTYTVTVGAGGTTRIAAYTSPGDLANGLVGGVSSIVAPAPFTPVTTSGGGGGGGSAQTAPNPTLPGGVGQGGGSGGGSGWGGGVGGNGAPGQGFPGGSGGASVTPGFASGGGGGAGGAGAAGPPGIGGIGVYSTITGANVGYAGGGPNNVGNTGPTTFGAAPGARSNSGAGGSGSNGQSGIVIISIPTNAYTGTISGSVSVNVVGSTTILTFSGSGTYTA